MRRLLVLVALVAVSCGGDDGETASESPPETTEAARDTGGAAGFEYGDTECAPAEKPAEPVRSFDGPFQDCLEDGVDYAAVMTTSEGAITFDLIEAEAPGTVNNFVNLARSGFYDGDDFHRVVPGFVIQGGDPVGEPQGTGDPGYSFGDEPPANPNAYVQGAVAMANSGPDTNGSQFFICTSCTFPEPLYSLFGQVTEGQDVVAAIDALGQGDGPPSRAVSIESVEITEA